MNMQNCNYAVLNPFLPTSKRINNDKAEFMHHTDNHKLFKEVLTECSSFSLCRLKYDQGKVMIICSKKNVRVN